MLGEPCCGQWGCREPGASVLGPILDLCWGILGPSLGPRWVFLGTSWAMLPHFGAFREAPGRHLEANAGLGSTDLELTCGKKATCQNLQTNNEQHRFFNGFWRWHVQESMQRWLFGGLVVVLKFTLRVSGAMLWSTGLPRANIIAAWAHCAPILDPTWPQDAPT